MGGAYRTPGAEGLRKGGPEPAAGEGRRPSVMVPMSPWVEGPRKPSLTRELYKFFFCSFQAPHLVKPF